MITRLAVTVAFVGMLLSVGSSRIHAQDAFEGNINSCSDLGPGFVDAGGLVTVTANDGTYLSYTATASVTAAVKGGDNYNVYASATSGVDLHAPLNGGGNVPAISHYLFCYVPGGENPVDDEPTCEADAFLCGSPVDEPTCETDASLCENPVDDVSDDGQPVDENPVDDVSDDGQPVDETSDDGQPDVAVADQPVDGASTVQSAVGLDESVVAFPNTGAGPADGPGGPAGLVAVFLAAVLALSTALGLRAQLSR